jgi:hypothetical protein
MRSSSSPGKLMPAMLTAVAQMGEPHEMEKTERLDATLNRRSLHP